MNSAEIVVRVQSSVEWVVGEGNNGYWIGICEPLKLTVQSDTETELTENIRETMDALLKDLIETGELDQFLSNRGWTLQDSYEHADRFRFDIPFSTTRKSFYGSAQPLYQ